MPAKHKIVSVTINTFQPGIKGAVKSSDGVTTHEVQAVVRVDKDGVPIAVCEGPDYARFIRSFGIAELQYRVFVEKGTFVIHARLDAANEVVLALGADDLDCERAAPIHNLQVFSWPAHWTYKVHAERHAGAMFDEFACSCRTHPDTFLALK